MGDYIKEAVHGSEKAEIKEERTHTRLACAGRFGVWSTRFFYPLSDLRCKPVTKHSGLRFLVGREMQDSSEPNASACYHLHTQAVTLPGVKKGTLAEKPPNPKGNGLECKERSGTEQHSITG